MSSRIDEWMQMENTVVKSYEQLRAENPVIHGNREYNEKILGPWTEQNKLENELRKKLGAPPDWATDKEKIEFHRRQLALLEKAKLAPRCEHIFTDGRRCRSPRLRKGKLCYAHTEMEVRRPRGMNLPPLEDANAVTMWLMEVSRGLLDGQISERTAGLLFYGLQLAMVNARWTTFAETNPEEMVRKMPKIKTITTEGTEATERRERSTEAEPACLANSGNRAAEPAQPRAAVPHVHEWSTQTESPEKEETSTESTEEGGTAGSEQGVVRRSENQIIERPQPRAPLPRQAKSELAGDPMAVPHGYGQAPAVVPHMHQRPLAIAGDQTAKSLFTGDEPERGGTSQ